MTPVAVVAGAVANKAWNGGATWTRLSWLRGLDQLGFDVHFVEQLDAAAPPGAQAYFERVMSAIGLRRSSTLLRPDGTTAAGLTADELRRLAARAAMLVNISGHLVLPEVTDTVDLRVFVDLDPGFTQIWDCSGTRTAVLDAHDAWFTVGESIGTAGCSVPTNGRPWRPIRQPVVLSDWPAVPAASAAAGRFTTVGSWRGPYGPVEHGGRVLGVKAHQFRRFLPLPILARGTYELALEIHAADAKDRSALEEHGWRLVDPGGVASDPTSFRRYVQGSDAEFSVAQSVYVDTASGWFSDRTVRYLASGRPALVQDTGFRRSYPTGSGLLAFTTLDEAVEGAEAILADHGYHCRAARALAEEWFAADRVLGRLCDELGVARPRRGSEAR
ncbi:MAG TPA: hypothetical protein VHF24_02665 [Acidimicrobiales bacterium]|nr:hypothetical protein [Acidimicrobiales bacterium]